MCIILTSPPFVNELNSDVGKLAIFSVVYLPAGYNVRLGSRISGVLSSLMQVFHWSRPAGNYVFLESGPMFTRSDRVGCSFPACRGGSVTFQTCLIFLRLLPTLVTDPKFIHLATGLSVNLRAYRLHFQACPYHLQACRNMKPACLL